MSRQLTALAAVVAVVAGGVTAVAMRGADDSLDAFIAKGAKIGVDLSDRARQLRGQLERTASGLVAGRIEIRP